MHSSDLASTLSPCSSVGAMGDIKITAMDIKITAMKIMSPMKIIGDIKITAMKIIFVIVHFCRRATQDVVCASVNSPEYEPKPQCSQLSADSKYGFRSPSPVHCGKPNDPFMTPSHVPKSPTVINQNRTVLYRYPRSQPQPHQEYVQ